MRTRDPRIALFALLLVLAGCRSERAGDPPTDGVGIDPVTGGTAVVGLIVDPQSMNSLTTNEAYSRMVQRQVLFTTLLRYDDLLQPAPWLAESWDTTRVGRDSLDLTFQLRPDVRWHDGTPTTVADVLFTFRGVRDPAVGSSLATSFSRYSPDVRVLDEHRVRFRLRAHADFLDGWAQIAIMPAHLLGETPSADLAQHPFGLSEPVGNGPFRFVRRNAGREWVFEANPDFPTELGGRPHLDRLVLRVIPEQTTLLTEVLNGSIDVYLRPRSAQIPELRRAPHVEIVTEPGHDWVFLGWNNRLPMFDTPGERRALTLGIDREALVAAVLDGSGVSGRSPVSPAHWAFAGDAGAGRFVHDPEGARRLLAAAGWEDRNGDGVLEDREGNRFSFTLLIPQGNDTGRDAAQIIQAQLARIGVEVRPSSVEGNTLISRIMGTVDSSGRRRRNYDAVVMGWSDGMVKDDSNLFHSRNLESPFQISGFSDARIDALLDTLQLVISRDQARPLWMRYQELMESEAPATVLFYPGRHTAVNRRLRGVVIDARDELHSVAGWWLQPASP